MDDLISRKDVLRYLKDQVDSDDTLYQDGYCDGMMDAYDFVKTMPSAQRDMEEKLYLYKCYITDEDGLQHEVIHTGDIRRVTGWEI